MTQEDRRISSGNKIVDVKVVHKGLSPVEIVRLQVLTDMILKEPIKRFKEEALKVIEKENNNQTESTRKELGIIYDDGRLD